MAVLMILFIGVVLVSMRGGIKKAPPKQVEGYKPWSEEVVKHVASMPMQEQERLKPISTWAAFKLYSMHSSRSIKITDAEGEKLTISPTEWLLDCLFRPELADQLPLFRVDDDRMISALGIQSDKKRRDYYSYKELIEGGYQKSAPAEEARLQKLKQMDDKLVGLDQQIDNLIQNVKAYEFVKNISDSLAYFRVEKLNEERIAILREQGSIPDAYNKDKLSELEQRAMDAYFHFTVVFGVNRQLQGLTQDDLKEYKFSPYEIFSTQQMSVFDELRRYEFRTFPPASKETTKWHSWFHTSVEAYKEKNRDLLVQASFDYACWEALNKAARSKDENAFLNQLQEYSAEVNKRAESNGISLKMVAYEEKLYKMDLFTKALVFFLMGCIAAMCILPSPGSKFGKISTAATWVLISLGLLSLVAGIVMRAVIMERFPLGNLYDTILFATAVGVFVLMFIEYVTKRRVGIGMGVTLGALGMFVAYSFEVGNASDHMTPLNAVLRSNFWLSTHVTTIIIGYAGGIVASILSIYYLLGRFTGVDEGDKNHRRFMTRVVYGTCCFTLLFSLVGTILGGIWANDSWGRFWGWDPKENGALMIVLWYLIILHARLAGYIKEWGLHICSVFGANIVAFSWWGVNFLSTGLHSYGFSSGSSGARWLMIYIIMHTAIVVIGLGYAWYEKAAKKAKKLAA